MSRRLYLLIFTILIGFLCGCQPIEYEFQQPLEQVEHVYLVAEKDGVEQRQECSIEILAELKALPCHVYWNDPPEMIGGDYILIEYSDGSTEAICSSENYHERDGKRRYGNTYFDYYDFSAVFQKYQTSN